MFVGIYYDITYITFMSKYGCLFCISLGDALVNITSNASAGYIKERMEAQGFPVTDEGNLDDKVTNANTLCTINNYIVSSQLM